MPNQRRFRGPRRTASGGPEGAAADAGPPIRVPAEGAGEARARRRRRTRGGRRPAAGQPAAGENQALAAPAVREPRQPRAPETEPAGEAPRRRRRRRSRGRRSEEPIAAEPIGEEAPPADYIALPVERGMPVLYQPRAIAEAEEPPRPAKTKRINSGKLFWYIRSKSYIPIPELRRRFDITPDEMATIQDDGRKLYIGLPQEIADVVANLRRQQKIGLECSADFTMPVVVGVYPLHPAS